jgi:hypothetical protein
LISYTSRRAQSNDRTRKCNRNNGKPQLKEKPSSTLLDWKTLKKSRRAVFYASKNFQTVKLVNFYGADMQISTVHENVKLAFFSASINNPQKIIFH